MISYKDFLLTKVAFAPETGFEISKDKINPALKPHQRDAVMWAVKGGRTERTFWHRHRVVSRLFQGRRWIFANSRDAARRAYIV